MYKEKNLKDMKHSLISLQAEYEWLENVDSCILRPSLEDLTKAYKNYFAKRSLYPKFKSKNNCNSYRTNCIKSSYKDSNYSNLILDKCLWYNKKLIKIASYYASSQIYNKCWRKEPNVKNLSIRKWTCKKCGSNNDRDLNASFNILEEGLKIYF